MHVSVVSSSMSGKCKASLCCMLAVVGGTRLGRFEPLMPYYSCFGWRPFLPALVTSITLLQRTATGDNNWA